MMRRVLVDAARSRHSQKRGGGATDQALSGEAAQIPAAQAHVDIVALEDALDALARVAPRPSEVVELRFFGGFTVEETAEALGISVRTVINDWNTARVWLYRQLAKRTAS
jgi:RNA polymerase sigma factor (TIGR02999 family)